MNIGMSLAVTVEQGVLRRYASDQIVTLAKLVVENAFQPIVEAGTGTVFGYESLMRGQERIGFDTPIEILDEAHHAGQLLQLEQMVASRALAKFAALSNFSTSTLFLNLDVRLIPHGERRVENLLLHMKKANIPPSSVCFEFSERFDNTSVPEFSALVSRLRKEGFKLAIDDFGVGHGEMKLLCDYPDRSGAEALFPLMRCSIGVIELPEGLIIDDINRVGAEIALIKSAAKESKEGLVFHLLGEAN